MAQSPLPSDPAGFGYTNAQAQQVMDIGNVSIKEKIELLGREETPIEFFAVDAKGSQDRDDAIAIVENPDGTVTYHVAVSDVASFIEKDSPLDERAKTQAVTRYHTSPPQNIFQKYTDPATGKEVILSDQYLSLASHPDPAENAREVDCLHRDNTRPNLLLISSVTLDDQNRVVRSEISRGWGRVHRISKKQAAHWIANDESPFGREDLPSWDKYAVQGAMRLAVQRELNPQYGFEDIFDIEATVVRDEDGAKQRIQKGLATVQLLIQEMMLQANQQTAKLFYDADSPYAFRNHAVRVSYKSTSHPIETKHEIADSPEHVERLRELEVNGDIENLQISPVRAKVQSSMQFHMGLGMPYYAWWTSPIRRYADLVNQRVSHHALDVVDALLDTTEESSKEAVSDILWSMNYNSLLVDISLPVDNIINIEQQLSHKHSLKSALIEAISTGGNGEQTVSLTPDDMVMLMGALPSELQKNARSALTDYYKSGSQPISALMWHIYQKDELGDKGLREFLTEQFPDVAIEPFLSALDNAQLRPPYNAEEVDEIAHIFNVRIEKAKALEASRGADDSSKMDEDYSLLGYAFPNTDAARLSNPLEYPYKGRGFSKLLQAAIQEVLSASYNDVIAQECLSRIEGGHLHARDYFILFNTQDHTDGQLWQPLKEAALEHLRTLPQDNGELSQIMDYFNLSTDEAYPLHSELGRHYWPTRYHNIDMRSATLERDGLGGENNVAIVVFLRDGSDRFSCASNRFAAGICNKKTSNEATLDFFAALVDGQEVLLDESLIPPELWAKKTDHLSSSIESEGLASEEMLAWHIQRLENMITADIAHMPEEIQSRARESLTSAYQAYHGNDVPITKYRTLKRWIEETFIPRYIEPTRDMSAIVHVHDVAERLANQHGYAFEISEAAKCKGTNGAWDVELLFRKNHTEGDRESETVIKVTGARTKAEAKREALEGFIEELCARTGIDCNKLDLTLPMLAVREWQNETPTQDNGTHFYRA